MLFAKKPPGAPRPPASVRLLPAAMTMVAVLLGLKAVAVAQDVAEAPPAANAPAAPPAQAAPANGQTAAQQAAQTQCTPDVAELAGLSASEVQVLQALGARRQQLDQRANSLETQDDLMTAAEHRLDERLAELHRLESTVNDLLGQLDEAQEHRLANLVDVYQRMRAKDAAAVFNGLDDDVMVQVASRMRQANLAEVMGRMQPDRARRLTQMLADRARPPTSGAALLQRAQAAPAAATTPAPAAGR